MPKLMPRGWQIEALAEWERANHRGIVSVVTGGGKTVFALSCIDRIRPVATLVVVPTAALLEQWWEEAASYFDLDLDEINIVTSNLHFRLGAINIAVLNTAAKLAERIQEHKCFLIVDECHRNGRSAHEVEGRLTVRAASLGFARFSAIDNCLRIARGCGLPVGNIQIVDQFGNLADWTVCEESGVLWIRKNRGPALITHDSYVQIMRSFEGRISIRPSST